MSDLSSRSHASSLAPDMADVDSGQVDRFTLLAAIGQGGMGELYAAYDAKLDRKVALKLVRAGRGSSRSDSRLLREAQALAKISHPNVVPVFEVGAASQRVFMAMEYVRRQTLGEWLEQARSSPEPERIPALLARFHEAALGLAAVHDAGLAHRDFKPDNVIVGDDERVRLVDFGLARSTSKTSEDWVESDDGGDTELLAGLEIDKLLTPDIEIGKLTNTGTLLRTPHYMAPEQWRAQRGDSRSDQFSFCVALYHALYDAWPYEADSISALSISMLEGSPREPPRVPAVPAPLRAALFKGLTHEPEQRNPDMRTLIEAIDATLRPAQRRQAISLAILAVLSVILIIAVVRAAVPKRTSDGADLHATIARPGVLRSEPRGLRLDLLNTPDPVFARRSFEWDGDHLELELELKLDIERLEWGSILNIDLVPLDASGAPMAACLARVRVGAIGGGGHYVLDWSNDHDLEPGSVHETPQMRAATPADDQRHVRFRVDLNEDPATGWVVVESSAPGGQPTSLAYEVEIPPEALGAGRYELQLSTAADPWMRGVVRLERLRLAGAREPRQVDVLTRREQALLANANADSDGALELIGAARAGELEPRDADWLAALALEQLGRWSEARPLIERAMGSCDDTESVARFAYAMLLAPDRFGPTLREHCARDVFLVRTWEVAWGALFHHPDLIDVHRTMTTQLIDLERCEPATVEQARACADLLTARSRDWYMQNQGAATNTDLRRAIELVDGWKNRPELDAEDRQTLHRLGALAHVRLAAVLVIRNLLDEAERELEAALAADLAPEIIADVIVARALFEPLHGRPIWAQVTATQAGLD